MVLISVEYVLNKAHKCSDEKKTRIHQIVHNRFEFYEIICMRLTV